MKNLFKLPDYFRESVDGPEEPFEVVRGYLGDDLSGPFKMHKKPYEFCR